MEFTHTKEQGIEAMNNLIANTTYTEADFVYSDDVDTELGLEIGTPLMKTYDDDDFITTAYDHWEDWLRMQSPDGTDDDMVDFYITSGLL